MTGSARLERELLATLRGAWRLEDLYALVEDAGEMVTGRDDGHRVVHGRRDTRWRRRVRGALQTLRRQGRARSVGDSMWVLEGSPERPRTALLVSLDGAHGDVELRLQSAVDLLEGLDEPADLIVTDPPYGLGVGTDADTGARAYARDASCVVGGYVDVAPDDYWIFTKKWVSAAAGAVRLGGHLAVVTGPQQAAWVQVSAEDAGLVYVNSVAVATSFPLRTTRRFAHAHWTVTIMCRGPLTSSRRVFTPPADLPKARSGADYPLDIWPAASVGRADAAPGEMRYPNSLPVRLVDRLVGAFTRPAPAEACANSTGETADLVVDPFLGGGTTAFVALRRRLRFVGGDLNPLAVAFTAQRLAVEAGSDTRTEGAGNRAPAQLRLL